MEIYELDDRKRKPRAVDEDFIEDVRTKVHTLPTALRTGTLTVDPHAKEVSRLRLPRHMHCRRRQRSPN